MPSPLEESVSLGRAEDWKMVEIFDPVTLGMITLPIKKVPGRDDLMIAFTAEGSPRAISALCPHRRLRLEEFARAGRAPGTIVCSAHSCVFNVATGVCINSHELSEAIPNLQSWSMVKDADDLWTMDQDEVPK